MATRGSVFRESIEGLPNLKEFILTELNNDISGVLTIDGYAVALLKIGENFYIFDSHSKGEAGYTIPNGTARCLNTNDINTLYKLLTQNVKKPENDNEQANKEKRDDYMNLSQ